MEDKVTVVTPTWNSAKYIRETIESVQAQTYQNWEMIIVDDCSTDNTVEIVKHIAAQDSRIKMYCLSKNQGAALARNRAIEESTGRYIAFLDADDLWKKNKIERQIQFMQNNNYAFSCTSYEIINDEGIKTNKIIHIPTKVNYKKYLVYNILQTIGIMIDTKIIDKQIISMPNVRISEDAATWLKILKKYDYCYGLDENLAEYRRRKGSLSSNKFISIQYAWNLYRNLEKLPLYLSIYCFLRYAILAIIKRIHMPKR